MDDNYYVGTGLLDDWPPKIENGSLISVGKKWSTSIRVDQHFNWFQKKMLKWCFGFNVVDYSEES